MMKSLSAAALCLCLLLSATSRTGMNPADGHPEGWIAYQNPAFSFQYPDSFRMDTSGMLGTSFMLFSRQAHPGDRFMENINLYIHAIDDPDMTLKMYADASREQIKTFITDVSDIEQTLVSDGPVPYYRFVYTGKQGQLNCKWVQRFYLRAGKIYLLTFTTEIASYEAYASVGEAIMQSFQIH